MSAIVFSGAVPIFIHPEIDDELGISHKHRYIERMRELYNAAQVRCHTEVRRIYDKQAFCVTIMSAIVFSGAVPIFIHPEIDDELGISHGITLESAE
jgi:arginine/lysine/ornithine decarboxylase